MTLKTTGTIVLYMGDCLGKVLMVDSILLLRF